MSTDRTSLAVCVDVLGPLALRLDGVAVEVAGARRRTLLALLALADGHARSSDGLVEALWPEGPPANAVAALHNHVSRLRRDLGIHAHRLHRQGAAYRLHLLPGELDADVVRRLAGEVASAPAARRAVLAREALSRWRGPALEEFRGVRELEPAGVGLDELRLRLVDDLVRARLDLGEPGVAADAAAAASAHPLREGTVLLLVRALAAEGRTADALEAARSFRRRLSEEAGLDPSPALGELEQRVAGGSLPVATAEPRHRVARPDGPLIGRERDRDEVVRLLGTRPVVTLTGPGGVGKTRLALDVAADLADGADVVVVELAAVDRDERLCQAVASTLDLRTPGAPTPEHVADALGTRAVLLVLDNCEHLAAACHDLVVVLRRRAPGVRVLATSRQTLHVPDEHVVRLRPLPVPREVADPASLSRQPAVRAFVEHARRRRADFELAADDVPDLLEVLRRLDGLPLGIELAARQVDVLPLRAVRERLGRALDLALDPGARPGEDDRQRTLRATIDSSYRLLEESAARLLRALAPFPGGVDLATVEHLGAGLGADPLDLLHRLVDSSLVAADVTSGRYAVLFTVRQFLLDELAAHGETEAAERRFVERCVAVAGEIARQVSGPEEPAGDRRLRAELDNVRAARDLAARRGWEDARVDLTLVLADAVTWRDLRETWDWALELARDPGLAAHPRRPELLGWAAEAARLAGDLDGAADLAEEAFAVATDHSDPALARAWGARGSVAHFRGDFAAAEDGWLRSAEARAESAGPLLGSAALAAAYAGRRGVARALLDRAHAHDAASGGVSHRAFSSYVEGELVVGESPEAAVPRYLEAIELARRAGTTFIEGVATVSLASARTRTGEVSDAAAGFVALLDLWRRTGQPTQLWTTARSAAVLLARAGRTREAALLVVTADAQPSAAATEGRVAPAAGDLELDEVREEAARRGAEGVLELAREALVGLAG